MGMSREARVLAFFSLFTACSIMLVAIGLWEHSRVDKENLLRNEMRECLIAKACLEVEGFVVENLKERYVKQTFNFPAILSFVYQGSPYRIKSKYRHFFKEQFPPGTTIKLVLKQDRPESALSQNYISNIDSYLGSWVAYGFAGVFMIIASIGARLLQRRPARPQDKAA